MGDAEFENLKMTPCRNVLSKSEFISSCKFPLAALEKKSLSAARQVKQRGWNVWLYSKTNKGFL